MDPTNAETGPETVPPDRTPRDPTHGRLVAALLAEGWQEGGWRKRVSRSIRGLGVLLEIPDASDEAPLLLEDLEAVQAIPDAWRIQSEGPDNDPHGQGWLHKIMVLEFAEVEVTHPMSEAKIAMYESLWWWFDASEYAHFRLWRVDRLGLRSEFPIVFASKRWRAA